MKSEQIRDLAIKRHDIDAPYFQKVYSGNYSSPQSEVFLYGRNMILEELELVLNALPKGSKVLDVGCGTGHLTNWIKSKGFEVYGLEASDAMFQLATHNFPEIDFKQGISSKLPYQDNYFDLIIAVEVLRYLDDAENETTYKDFYRVLKNGGKIFVTHVNLFASDGYYFFYQLKNVMSRINKQPYHFCNFTTPAKQRKMLSNLNFRNIVIVGRMAGIIRVFYKFGKIIGKGISKLFELVSKQKYVNGALRTMAGHLIVVAEK